MKLFKQILGIILFISFFVLMDVTFYTFVAKRYIGTSSSKEMKEKSVEVSQYLPFEENSRIVKFDSELTLTGDLPILDGAAATYPVFSAFVNSVYPPESVSFDGNDFSPDSALQYRNTRGAFKAIADGDVDIIFCLKPSYDQWFYAREQGAELEMVPVLRDAFVFIVNEKNPINELTSQQVKDIYAGKHERWSEVGGDNSRIDAVQRNAGSGSQTTMLDFMYGTDMKHSGRGFFGRSIGYSFRYYVTGITQAPNVKMLTIDGVEPTTENITNGTYPIIADFYAIYRKDDDNPNIQILIDWILSEEGQTIVEESGYARVN